MAARMFNAKQARETAIVDLWAAGTFGDLIAATGTLDLTNDIILTSVAGGAARNTNTLTVEVEAAAANPTDTILAVFTGTAAAITVTITPNDGTNNSATPVNMTTAELRELITTGAVVGKTVTVTDASSLRALQTATGGGAANLADGGQGDGVVATFAGGGAAAPTLTSSYGVLSISRTDVGDFALTLDGTYAQLKFFKMKILNTTARDLRAQVKAETVSSTKIISFFTLTGATATEPVAGTPFLIKMELKNSGKPW